MPDRGASRRTPTLAGKDCGALGLGVPGALGRVPGRGCHPAGTWTEARAGPRGAELSLERAWRCPQPPVLKPHGPRLGEKGAEARAGSGVCSHPRAHTPLQPGSQDKAVPCPKFIAPLTLASGTRAGRSRAGLSRRGWRQEEFGWLSLGTGGGLGLTPLPERLPKTSCDPEAGPHTSMAARPGRGSLAASFLRLQFGD